MSIELIVGPMYSGKTSELFRRLKRLKIARKSCIMIKYANDIRYSQEYASTHDREFIPAISTLLLNDMFSEIQKYDVICIDEGQFFPDLVSFCNHLANQNKKVIVSALDGTFQRRPFDTVANLIPHVESLTKLTAICAVCGQEASFTRRITNEEEVEVIGNEDKYQAVCRKHFS